MEKTKTYYHTRFSADVIREASTVFDRHVNASDKNERDLTLTVDLADEKWHHEDEEEFFADYRQSPGFAHYGRSFKGSMLELWVYEDHVSVGVRASNRSQIQAVFEVFESSLEKSRLPVPAREKPGIFVGHGRSPLWRDLKDHLHEKHGYPIEAYEIGARAGHAVRDVLEELLDKSSFAVLVMTAEDETSNGHLRARQNVIHEIGLFQGRLGFRKAIVLVEEGTEEFSNIHGVEQIRFRKGNITETFGDVLATIKREFPE